MGPGPVVALTALLAVMFVVANVAGMEVTGQSDGVPYVRLYDPPKRRLEVVVNQGDGQAFAALAQDPLLRRPQVFRGGPPEAAYRAQRPLLGWLAFLLSAGQATAVPLALVVLSTTGFVMLGAVLAWLLVRSDAPAGWALAILATPGALVTLDWTGPECIGTAAALLGVAWWRGDRRLGGVALLIAAALLRESLLLVPAALIGFDLIVERRGWRSVGALSVPFLAYVGWLSVVWLRLGALPVDAGRGRLASPLTGVFDAASGWDATNMVCAAAIVGFGAFACWLGRREPLGWVAGAFVAASLAFGPDVWARVEDFSRILLPAVAAGGVVIASSYSNHGDTKGQR